MPVEPLMQWKAASARWTKMYRGKTYYVSCKALGVPPTKGGSMAAANEWWRAKQEEIDGYSARPEPGSSRAMQALLEAWAGQPLTSEAEAAAALFNLTEHFKDKPMPREVKEAILGSEKLRQIEVGVDALLDAPAVPTEKTIGRQFEVWAGLQFAAKKSIARKKMNIHMLGFFKEFMGESASLETITEDKWEAYWLWLSKKDHDDGYKGRILALAKNFLRWLAGKRLIELPRNLDDGALVFEGHVKEIKPLELLTVRKFFGAATGQTRLHILLGLNCGMLPKDIAELHQSEVNWEKGTITRKRSKTRKLAAKKAKSVPVVSYQLWTTTFALLKEYRSQEDLVLLTGTGKPWIQEELEAKVGGKYKYSNSIASNFKWLCKKAKVKVTPKQLRTTAATTLGEHKQYKFYVEYFLGEAPSGTTARHYHKPSDREFFDALAWLEKAVLDDK